MKSSNLERSALVITPSPHIPREYGNRNRVFQTIGFLKSFGYAVSCLLYPFDEEWERTVPPYYADLTAEFDYFAVIPNSKKLHQPAADYHHQIDEWWDENIGHHLTWLFERKRFDLLFVNYTFFSKAFEFAPKGVFRVLDTHDLFTGRRETFEQFGVKPEFFYTNAQQESTAFNRADAVIAIKQSERDLLKTMTSKQVISIPYWDQTVGKSAPDRVFNEPTFSHERPLRLGFIGAQNSVNTVNIGLFLKKMARYVAFYNVPVEIMIAGNVCRQVASNYRFVKKLGRIPEIADFYRNIDAVIAPLEFSTGIKIKVGEALAWQLPVLATQNAFDGFQVFHSSQSEQSVDAVCNTIVRLAYNEISYKQLTLAARRSARAAAKAQEIGFQQLRESVRHSSAKILFVTDRPFWHRSTYVDELVAQTLEYVSAIAPTIVINLCSERPGPSLNGHAISYLQISSEAAFGSWLTDAAYLFRPIASMRYINNDNAQEYRNILADHLIPSWKLCVGAAASNQTASVVLAAEAPRHPITLSPLRYAPLKTPALFRLPGVVLWFSNPLSEWETLIISLIETVSNRAGLNVTKALIPDYAEFDTGFFSQSISNSLDRWIMLRRNSVAETFLLYTAQYLNIRTLILEERIACPENLLQSKPSVAKSLQTFLKGGKPGAIRGRQQFWMGNALARDREQTYGHQRIDTATKDADSAICVTGQMSPMMTIYHLSDKNRSLLHAVIVIAVFAVSYNTMSWSAELQSGAIHGVNLALLSPSATPEWDLQKQMEVNRKRILDVKVNGFNAIRLKTFPSIWTSDNGGNLERTSQLLDDFVATARANGITTVITLFADFGQGAQQIVCDASLQERLLSASMAILARYPDDPKIGIDILNEPPLTCPTNDKAVWDSIQYQMYKAIRKNRKHVVIFLSGGSYGSLEGLSHITTSNYLGDRQIFFTFHFYRPFTYTHQGANWLDPPFYKYLVNLPWPYASNQVQLAEMAANRSLENDPNVSSDEKQQLHVAMQAAFSDYLSTGTAKYISDEFDLVSKWMKNNGVLSSQVVISEFGVNRMAGGQHSPPRLGSARWISDVRSNIQRVGINWMVWDLDGSLSVLCGQPPETICREYADALKQ